MKTTIDHETNTVTIEHEGVSIPGLSLQDMWEMARQGSAAIMTLRGRQRLADANAGRPRRGFEIPYFVNGDSVIGDEDVPIG